MSLLKYTVFIKSLLEQLKNSPLCCNYFSNPSMPVGYADDLAAACLSKVKMDRAMEVVYAHGHNWRYDFNAKKSGILVFGNTQREHDNNSVNRVFTLGPYRVGVRAVYEHVGISVGIYSHDTSGITNCLTKATCNNIFWSILVPVAIYGCELWHLNDDGISELESFQNYTCRIFFYPRVPNASNLYSLGKMRLER